MEPNIRKEYGFKKSYSPIHLAKGSQTAWGPRTLVEDRGCTKRPVVFKHLVIGVRPDELEPLTKHKPARSRDDQAL